MQPTSDSSQFLRAYCYIALNQGEKAEALAQKILEENVLQAEAYFILAYVKANRPLSGEETSQIIKEIGMDSVKYAEYSKHYYIDFQGMGQIQIFPRGAALEILDTALLLAPEDDYYHYIRAQFLLDLQQAELALEAINKALSLYSDDPEYFTFRAYMHSEKGAYEKAVEDYSSAIALDPEEPSYYQNRAFLLYSKLERPEEGCEDLRKAILLGAYVDDFKERCE